MKKHKYKLATLVLSTGLVLGACGDAEETDPAGDIVEEGNEDTSTEFNDDAETSDDASDDGTDDTTGESTVDDTSEDEADTEEDTGSGD